ncbi:hypothetical protein HDU76_007030 [Blyttiomyces sp. JEL0837]|nr:hypothetical protein HDU76_007030 [Blyttiomyces sp. JEL0837]
MQVKVRSDGSLKGEPREEGAPFTCAGNISAIVPHKVTFTETEKVFDGVFVEEAIAGRWHKKEAPDIRGRLCLFRISDPPNSHHNITGPTNLATSKLHGSKNSLLSNFTANFSKVVFRPGRWSGCVWNDTDHVWENVFFAWLEVRGTEIFGKDETTDDNIFRTTRGIYEPNKGKIKIFVTEWFDQDSTIFIYSGRIVSKDGHIKGIRIVSGEDTMEDLADMEEQAKSGDFTEEDGTLFRMWRVDGNDEIEWLESLMNGGSESGPLNSGVWQGTWKYEGGYDVPDNCLWTLKYTSEGNRIIGQGVSVIDGMEEGFFCDGIYDSKTGKIKLYQSYQTTLTIYVFDLTLESKDKLVGKGSSRDDSEGLVVEFEMNRRVEPAKAEVPADS